MACIGVWGDGMRVGLVGVVVYYRGVSRSRGGGRVGGGL